MPSSVVIRAPGRLTALVVGALLVLALVALGALGSGSNEIRTIRTFDDVEVSAASGGM